MPSHPSPDPYAAAVAPSPAPPRKSRWRLLWWALAWLLVLLVALAALAWWWTGSSSSLPAALSRAAAYLPAGQQLETSEVSGSLRTGGRIGHLRWSNETLEVEVEDVQIGWQLAPLLQRKVQLGEVHAARITLRQRGEKTSTEPPEPLQELVLPLQVDVPFRVDHLVWAGRGPEAQPFTIDALAGHYRYDGEKHRLDVDHVQLAQGEYALKATLGARAPMPLDATLTGTVHTPVPGSDTTLAAQAQAHIQGTLATREARLDVTAQLRGTPEGADGPPLRADVQARIAPWLEQPLVQAQADLQGVDLALLWPEAPATQLAGKAGVEPEGDSGWRITADLTNAQPGPWDTQRLPLAALQGEAHYDGATWSVPQASVQAGGGSVQTQGSFTPATRALEGQVRVQSVNPAQLHTRMAPAPLTGTASARGSLGDSANGNDGSDGSDGSGGSATSAVRFQADLRASAPRQTRAPRAGELPPIALQRLVADGRWQGSRIDIQQLLVQAQGAQLNAQKLLIDTTLPSVRGRAQAELPGMQAQFEGDIAPRSGNGTLALQLSDAGRAQQWLAGLPVPLMGWSMDGRAALNASWRGGWQAALVQLQSSGLMPPDTEVNPSAAAAQRAPRAAPGDFTLQAKLQTPRLQLSRAPVAGSDTGPLALELTRTSVSASGSLRQLALQADATLRQDQQQASVQLRGDIGSRGPGRWQGELQALQLQASIERQPGPWGLRLDEPLPFSLQQTPRLLLEAGAASARLTGPEPGEVRLRWQPLRYAQGAQGALELTSQGAIEGLPLAWANAVKQDGKPLLTHLGISGDLRLGATWDIAANADAPLRAQVSVRRSSGDLRIATGESLGTTTVVSSSGEGKAAGERPQVESSATTSAGLRELTLELFAEGEELRARARWDSERAGRVQAEGSTRLARTAQGWSWPESAPLAATVKAELPEVGVWSVLAPPGWRVHGTLSADARLSGSRAAPLWTGRLAADRFAVRSVLDGVDLKDGRLRATLSGDRIDITELHLKGGRGSSARIAGYSGNRTAAPVDGGTLSGSGTLSWAGMQAAGQQKTPGSGITMDLQAHAEALQVLVRADRQVSVSGDVSAKLRDGQLVLRGELTADRATIILPEAGAPTLGDDVIVRSAALDKAAAEKAQQTARASQRQAQPQASVQAARPPDIAVTINLGDDFAFQGKGITTRLKGSLVVRSNGPLGSPPSVIGEVRTDQGRYRAWGQALNVETGLIRFSGAYDNPSLDVLALRPNIAIRAGVQVTGSAKAPRVRLYSEPELPDAEKLSWVVLGRSGAGGGAEAALLQQAALALLSGGGDKSSSGGIAQRLGLDEIGFKGPGQGEDATGAAVTLGKRLSKDLYVTYESSLSGAVGTLYILYDLTKRLTLRGQTGQQSALDLIYTVRWD